MPKLHPDLKRDWIEALRSGRYKQGTGYLRISWFGSSDCYCCLGVLCELLREPLGLEISQNGEARVYDGFTSVLPDAVTGFTSISRYGCLTHGVVDEKGNYHTSLADCNDSGMTFPEIADIIEEQF